MRDGYDKLLSLCLQASILLLLSLAWNLAFRQRLGKI